MQNFDNYHHTAIDLPDSRDYTQEEIFGEIGANMNFPKKFFLDKAKLLAQGSIGACTIFGSLNAYNEKIANASEHIAKIDENTAWKAWAECKNRGATDAGGWIFQSALQVLKDQKIIGAYININTAGHANVERMKSAIFGRKSWIATGLNSINWRATLINREYTKGSYAGQGAHIFDIIGWDDEKILPSGKTGAFLVHNSWIPDGSFWIAYADIGDLYSQYEFALTSEQERIAEAKKRRKNNFLQKSFEAKIWNEERPVDMATAEEIAKMLNRALGKIDKNISENFVTFRASWAMIFEEKIVRGKAKIYNEERKYELATANEVAIMFTRAVTRNAQLNTLVLSREQVAEVIGRDFL